MDDKKIFGIGIVVGIVLHSLIKLLCGQSYEKERVRVFFNFLVSVGASMVAYYIYKWLNRNDRTTEHKRVD